MKSLCFRMVNLQTVVLSLLKENQRMTMAQGVCKKVDLCYQDGGCGDGYEVGSSGEQSVDGER